jgi:hypothetical protein
MNDHALLIHALMRHASVDSPENVRRRERLSLLEREARLAHRRRRRERIRGAWNALIRSPRTGSDDWMRHVEAPDLREVLR